MRHNMKYTEITGDLIELAKLGHFDVIVHGCNCFCTMKAGIAPKMARAFGCNLYPLEDINTRGDMNKLGQIDFVNFNKGSYGDWISTHPVFHNLADNSDGTVSLTVVNAYTQYSMGTDKQHLDYDALRLCLRKINHIFKGKKVGLPQIGSGLAGGDWALIKKIIQEELTDVITIVVIYSP